MTAAETVLTSWQRGLTPDPQTTIDQWADQHRRLNQRASAEPGQWRTDRVPYMREVMEALSPTSGIERVVLQAGAQLAKTEVGLNFLAYVMDQSPGPIMLVQPSLEMAKRVSKQRIDGMVQATPRLREKIRPARERDSGNTVLMKDFAGGTLVLTGANSSTGLRSMPVRYLFMDEVDAFPPDAGGEGSPIDLAEARTSTFLRRKVFLCSTPTVEGTSAIAEAYENTDQRQYHLPCPSCGDMHVLAWKDITWTALDRDPGDAAWVCPSCGGVAEHSQKPWMLAGGEWRPTVEGPPRVRGYKLSGLLSPWVSWGQIAREFVAAKTSADRLKVWTNTRLGETFKDLADQPDWRRLAERADAEQLQPGVVPAGAAVLIAGVDTQDDRLEVEVLALGPGMESWSVDYRALPGAPDQPDVWRQLDQVLAENFPHEAGGSLQIHRLAIDTGGHFQGDVLAWAARQPADRVLAIKGTDNLAQPIGAPSVVDINVRSGKRVRRGGRLWPVGSSLLKGRLYSWLAHDPPGQGEDAPHGYCHFPRYSDEYFKQLTAERKVKRKDRRGYVKFEWEKVRERNEALDCRVYAMAAAETLRLDRWTEADWQAARANLTGDRPTAAEKPRVRKSSWLDR